MVSYKVKPKEKPKPKGMVRLGRYTYTISRLVSE